MKDFFDFQKVSKSKSNSSTNLEDSDSEESSRPPQSNKSARGRSGFALIAPESDDDDDDQVINFYYFFKSLIKNSLLI